MTHASRFPDLRRRIVTAALRLVRRIGAARASRSEMQPVVRLLTGYHA